MNLYILRTVLWYSAWLAACIFFFGFGSQIQRDEPVIRYGSFLVGVVAGVIVVLNFIIRRIVPYGNDTAFLLSESEANSLFETKYARIAYGTEAFELNNDQWALRTFYDKYTPALVDNEWSGRIFQTVGDQWDARFDYFGQNDYSWRYDGNKNSYYYGVRPALWVDIDVVE